jgi:hypothetical protein
MEKMMKFETHKYSENPYWFKTTYEMQLVLREKMHDIQCWIHQNKKYMFFDGYCRTFRFPSEEERLIFIMTFMCH